MISFVFIDVIARDNTPKDALLQFIVAPAKDNGLNGKILSSSVNPKRYMFMLEGFPVDVKEFASYIRYMETVFEKLIAVHIVNHYDGNMFPPGINNVEC